MLHIRIVVANLWNLNTLKQILICLMQINKWIRLFLLKREYNKHLSQTTTKHWPIGKLWLLQESCRTHKQILWSKDRTFCATSDGTHTNR